MDLPDLIIESVDVPVDHVVGQLRAVASGMDGQLDIPDLRLTLSLKISFRVVGPPIGRIDADGRWDISDRD